MAHGAQATPPGCSTAPQLQAPSGLEESQYLPRTARQPRERSVSVHPNSMGLAIGTNLVDVRARVGMSLQNSGTRPCLSTCLQATPSLDLTTIPFRLQDNIVFNPSCSVSLRSWAPQLLPSATGLSLSLPANTCSLPGTRSLGLRSDGVHRASCYPAYSSTRYWIESLPRYNCEIDAMICRCGPGEVGLGCQVMQLVLQDLRLVRTSAVFFHLLGVILRQ